MTLCTGRSEDEEEDAQHEPSSVIQTNQEIVQNAFSTTLTNVERRRVRNSFGTADLPNTRCPRLDPVFKTSIAKASEAKAMDDELARIQAFVLDPVLWFLQLGELRMAGALVAMSVVQGGAGLPTLLPVVYNYIAKSEYDPKEIRNSDVQFYEVQVLLDEVCDLPVSYYCKHINYYGAL